MNGVNAGRVLVGGGGIEGPMRAPAQRGEQGGLELLPAVRAGAAVRSDRRDEWGCAVGHPRPMPRRRRAGLQARAAKTPFAAFVSQRARPRRAGRWPHTLPRGGGCVVVQLTPAGDGRAPAGSRAGRGISKSVPTPTRHRSRRRCQGAAADVAPPRTQPIKDGTTKREPAKKMKERKKHAVGCRGGRRECPSPQTHSPAQASGDRGRCEATRGGRRRPERRGQAGAGGRARCTRTL